MKALKYKAIERGKTIAQMIDEAVRHLLYDSGGSSSVLQEKQAQKAYLRKVSGTFSLGGLSPQKIKEIIMEQYDEKVLH